jgi:hypothetical protein
MCHVAVTMTWHHYQHAQAHCGRVSVDVYTSVSLSLSTPLPHLEHALARAPCRPARGMLSTPASPLRHRSNPRPSQSNGNRPPKAQANPLTSLRTPLLTMPTPLQIPNSTTSRNAPPLRPDRTPPPAPRPRPITPSRRRPTQRHRLCPSLRTTSRHHRTPPALRSLARAYASTRARCPTRLKRRRWIRTCTMTRTFSAVRREG